jgi:hypothetical protein
MKTSCVPSRSLALVRGWLIMFVASCVLFASCSRSDRVAVSPVRGQVFAASNEPAAGALVVFHPVEADAEPTLRPVAYVDEEGNFELTTYEQGDGAPLGEYAITVEWREKPATPFSADKEGKDRLRGKYANPAASKLRFTVDGGAEHVVPVIHLE